MHTQIHTCTHTLNKHTEWEWRLIPLDNFQGPLSLHQPSQETTLHELPVMERMLCDDNVDK